MWDGERMGGPMPDDKIRVIVLEDHPATTDGYFYRLGRAPGIEIVASGAYGSSLEPMLAEHRVDVALLDVRVPTAPDNPNFYPIMHVLPRLLDIYPDLDVLVISMSAERALVQAIMDAGASGYILKDDQIAYERLAGIIESVAAGDIYLSPVVHKLLEPQVGQAKALLTHRQLEALSLAASHPEWTRADLAVQLGIQPSTARNLLSSVYMRLEVRNLTSAVARAQELGLIAL